MKLRKAAVWLLLIFGLYVCVLTWGEREHHVLDHLGAALHHLPWLIAASLASYLVRYQRWRMLLGWVGHSGPWRRGVLAYLAGFAFTATPGKAGELLRIRYLQPMGVPPRTVISAFILERSLDLLVVLMLSLTMAGQSSLVGLALAFVLFFVLLVLGLARFPQPMSWLQSWLERRRFDRWALLVAHLRDGFCDLRHWSVGQLLVSLGIGLLAWSLTAVAFLGLLEGLQIEWQGLAPLGIYPLAMLVGAASMLPGGLGSTEAAIVVQLQWFDVPLSLALLVAVVARLGTLWVAVVLGFLSILVLELRGGVEEIQP